MNASSLKALSIAAALLLVTAACSDLDPEPKSLSFRVVEAVQVAIVQQIALDPDNELSDANRTFLSRMHTALAEVHTPSQAVAVRQDLEQLIAAFAASSPDVAAGADASLASASEELAASAEWKDFEATLHHLGDMPSVEQELIAPLTALLEAAQT